MMYNFFSAKRKINKEEDMDYQFTPTVTFLLPGWNEGININTTIKSIQELKYPKDKVKIIYIDNNSTDNTKQIIKDLQKDDDRIEYLFEVKQGKHNAMNSALKLVNTDLIACLDVDSTLDASAMYIAAQYFYDVKTMAVASCMQLRDVKTVWQRIQTIEYTISIFWRKSYSTIDAIQVMPGPFSIFRKEVFDIVGEYHGAHNAEDLEMTLRLHKHHMKIANAHKAYVYTVGPSTFKSLLRQRVRWIRGFLENAWDYRDMFFKKEYGHFGMFTLPVAATFIFYVLYAMSFTLFNTVRLWSIRIEEYLYTGIHVPTFNFDPFYLSTDILMVQSIFLLTMLGIILTISRGIANDKSNLFMNLIFYILLYPIIGSAFVFISVYKFLFNKENKWHIQDNKIQPNITN